MSVEILVPNAEAAGAALGELADVLADCVAGGASVSFMLPFGRDDAAAYFEKVIASVARDETVLVAARLNGRIVGTVQLGLDMPPNQPHRADIRKLLVHRSARNHGIGAALMAGAEAEAKARGRTLLVLDPAGARRGAALRAHRLRAPRVHPGLCDVAGRRLLRHDVFLEAPLIPPPKGEGGRRRRPGGGDAFKRPHPSAPCARAHPPRAAGRDNQAARTCPASQPSIARLRVSPQW